MVLEWSNGLLESFQVASLGRGLQTLAGWVAEGWRLGAWLD